MNYRNPLFFCVLSLFILLNSCSKPKSKNSAADSLFKNTFLFDDAWARPAAAQGAGSAYFIIRNGYEKTDTLMSASSPVAEDVQIHESYQTGEGLSGMRQLHRVVIPGQSTVPFQPGGLHVMLLNLNRNLQPGDSLEITLYFANLDSLNLQIPVRE